VYVCIQVVTDSYPKKVHSGVFSFEPLDVGIESKIVSPLTT
jgi:hypothetical protein